MNTPEMLIRYVTAILCWLFGLGAFGLVVVVPMTVAVIPAAFGMVLILVGFGCLRLPPAKPKAPSCPCPAWFLPAGIIALILGLLGFLASAAVGGGDDFFWSNSCWNIEPVVLHWCAVGNLLARELCKSIISENRRRIDDQNGRRHPKADEMPGLRPTCIASCY